MSTYISIDLKSYFASAECAARGLDPLTTNLVVADLSRTEKTICLAVTPSLKAYGIPGRARLFEVIQKAKEVNAERLRKAIRLGVAVKDPATGKYSFSSSSSDATALAADPSLELSYIVAPPRMLLYEKVSTQIFSIYSTYVSPEDIHVYSIDEVFIDVTAYLTHYNLTPRELAIKMIREVLKQTGITATAGIGSNLYLAKIAMDIVAKKMPADKDGVRIAELDEMSYRELLWCHTPLTDFWRVGKGIANRLSSLGLTTMGDIARQSVRNESVLYDALGVNAELLIDHAWGWEPVDLATIKSYKPETTSISSGQVLKEPYDFSHGRLIVREMTELLVLDLVRKGLVTRQMVLTIDYDRSCIAPRFSSATHSSSSGYRATAYVVVRTGKPYTGTVTTDHYGRPCPKHAHGTGNLERWTSSTQAILAAVLSVYDEKVDKDLTIRRVNIATCNLIPENEIPEKAPEQLTLFMDYDALEREKKERQKAEARERKIQQATLAIQDKYGKNALLKGMNLLKGATTIERNGQVGGHRAGTDTALPANASFSPAPQSVERNNKHADKTGGDTDE